MSDKKYRNGHGRRISQINDFNKEYYVVIRFGGWQAKWLSPIVMMTGEQHHHDAGLLYTRTIENIARPMPTGRLDSMGRWKDGVESIVYLIGIVDIDETWLRALIPDEKKYAAFMKGNEREFFAE